MPVVRQLQDLHRESALLAAQLRHSPSDGQFAARIMTLGRSVEHIAAELDGAIALLPERQQSHSRLQDIRRSLDQLRRTMPRRPWH